MADIWLVVVPLALGLSVPFLMPRRPQEARLPVRATRAKRR